jgi:hypothetical protein
MSASGLIALSCDVGVGDIAGVRVVRLEVMAGSFTSAGAGSDGCKGRGVADGASGVNHHLPLLLLVEVGAGG